MRLFRTTVVLMAFAQLAFLPPARGKDKGGILSGKATQDAFQVVGHFPLPGGVVIRFLSTRHYSSYYLYAEHEGGTVTLLDVSMAAAPILLADLGRTPDSGSSSLFAVAGTAALAIEPAAEPQMATRQNVRIMDLSETKQPRVAREFPGVTAISRDDTRGLIFLANAEGIWILRAALAVDPEVEREYARHVFYDH